MSKNIYICHTVYHIYISLLKCYKEDDADILLVDTIKNVNYLNQRLSSVDLFNNVIVVNRQKIFGKKINTFIGNYFNNRLRQKNIKNHLSYLHTYKNIYIYNDYSEIGDYLELNGIKYHLLEDGLDTFKLFDQYSYLGRGYIIKRILYKLFKIPYSIGQNKNCIDIEVNDGENLKTKLKKPIIIKNRKKLLENISEGYLDTIFYIFGADKVPLSKNKLLVLTQVLKELSVVSNDEEQVEFYKKAIKKFNNGLDVYIKPHPRDLIDYHSIETELGVVCLNREIPMEVYSLLPGMQFKLVITYSSTAAYADNLAEQIIRLDTIT